MISPRSASWISTPSSPGQTASGAWTCGYGSARQSPGIPSCAGCCEHAAAHRQPATRAAWPSRDHSAGAALVGFQNSATVLDLGFYAAPLDAADVVGREAVFRFFERDLREARWPELGWIDGRGRRAPAEGLRLHQRQPFFVILIPQAPWAGRQRSCEVPAQRVWPAVRTAKGPVRLPYMRPRQGAARRNTAQGRRRQNWRFCAIPAATNSN